RGRASLVVGALDYHTRVVAGLSDREPVTVELHPQQAGERQRVEFIGFGFTQLAPSHDGLLVKAMLPNGGALEAGIRVGDVLTAIDGESLVNPDEGTREQFLGTEGSTARFTVKRASGETVELTARRKALSHDG